MSLLLCVTAIGCGDPSLTSQEPGLRAQQTSNQTRLPDGQYAIQQATYNDGNGEYSVILLNTPTNTPSAFQTSDLPMARLTDAEVQAGQKSYLKVENGKPSLHLTEDFKIEYIHNVAEQRTDPSSGRTETVIVRQEPSFWTPFAGAIAGQLVANWLFTPHYYVPPVYQPGVVLRGYGGYGSTYGQAVNSYQARYQAPPPVERNRQILRTTGRLRSTSPTAGTTRTYERDRATGSGYGSTRLRQSGRSSTRRAPSSRSFGSGSRSYSGSRRR